MNDDDFEIIKVLKILFVAILFGLGTVLGIFSLIKERKKQMRKIIFEFSEIDHDDITITIDATHTEVIFAATILIDRLAANMRKGTKVSKGKAIEQVLATAKKFLENAQKGQETDNKQWEISNE